MMCCDRRKRSSARCTRPGDVLAPWPVSRVDVADQFRHGW
jgi:hypothetical protein